MRLPRSNRHRALPRLRASRGEWRLAFLTGVILGLSALLLSACAGTLPFAKPSSRILFIGNSFTFQNDGVDRQLQGMDPSIAVDRLAVGGYTLEDHWNSGVTLRTIDGQKWNYVVLQEQSQTPVVNQAKFMEFAKKLNSRIRADGAETILFMTWERPDSVRYGVTAQNLAYVYYLAGNQIGAKVAPVGMAFANAGLKRPQLLLYVEDGHPTIAGTYLAACVIYATALGKTPVGINYAPAGMSRDDRDFLQRIAAESTGY